jgi:hypothetical protein
LIGQDSTTVQTVSDMDNELQRLRALVAYYEHEALPHWRRVCDERHKEIADLKAALALSNEAGRRLKAELEVRTLNYGFMYRPSEIVKRCTGAAWDSGFEAGWRGWPNKSHIYTSRHHQNAYDLGYNEAQRQSTKEIERLLQPA